MIIVLQIVVDNQYYWYHPVGLDDNSIMIYIGRWTCGAMEKRGPIKILIELCSLILRPLLPPSQSQPQTQACFVTEPHPFRSQQRTQERRKLSEQVEAEEVVQKSFSRSPPWQQFFGFFESDKSKLRSFEKNR